jgi:hypothetical protein
MSKPLENVPAGELVLGPRVRRFAAVLDLLLAVGALAVILAWFIGKPLFYTDLAPVMSGFTAFSLLIMVLVRLARLYLDTWPMALSLAMTGFVLAGNLSSVVMLATMPPGLMESFSVVLTSMMTSVGLMLFCLHDLVIVLRETPQSVFILDDMLLHLALVPGALSMLGVLLDIPGYLSVTVDRRVGISPLEMAFMGTYAVSAVLTNPRLFLWQFLATGWAHRIVFAGLFANQFIAPLVVAFTFSLPGAGGPGVELYAMLAGVVATLSFLLLQSQIHRRDR